MGGGSPEMLLLSWQLMAPTYGGVPCSSTGAQTAVGGVGAYLALTPAKAGVGRWHKFFW